MILPHQSKAHMQNLGFYSLYKDQYLHLGGVNPRIVPVVVLLSHVWLYSAVKGCRCADENNSQSHPYISDKKVHCKAHNE